MTEKLIAEGALPLSNASWAVEIGGWVAFVAIGAFLAYKWWRKGEPGNAALLFIGCFTMWWQEFYADWGAYLYYNPDLMQLPWGDSPLTTPNKPLYVLAGYGWFYAGGFTLILTLFVAVRKRVPAVPRLVALGVTTLVPFYLWNLVTADAVSFATNWYQYLHPIGPAIHTSKGGLPLLYPAFPFVFFAPAVVFSLYERDQLGRTWFESLFGVRPGVSGWAQRLHQVVAWCLGMNILYAICLTIPLLVVRILFLPDNSWVPTGAVSVALGWTLLAVWVAALAIGLVLVRRWHLRADDAQAAQFVTDMAPMAKIELPFLDVEGQSRKPHVAGGEKDLQEPATGTRR